MVALHPVGFAVVHIVETDIAAMRLQFRKRRAFAQQPQHLDRLDAQRHPAGLNAGQIKDVLDHRQQVLASAADMRHFFLHILVIAHGGFVLEQLRKAEDGVERCAQLVAHAGEEDGLGMAGQFGRFLGGAQLFGLLALGRIQNQGQQHRMILEHRQLQMNFNRINAAVGAAMHAVEDNHLFFPTHQRFNHAAQCGLGQSDFDLEQGHGAQAVHGISQVAQRTVVRIVEAQRPEIDQVNLGQAALDDAGKAVALLARANAVGDIGTGTEHAQRFAVCATRHHLATHQDPFPAAVLAAHPVLALVGGGAALKAVLQARQYQRAIIRVDAALPGKIVGVHLALGIAEYFRPARGSMLLAGDHIEIPDGIARAFERELPALLADAQLFQGAGQLGGIGGDPVAERAVPEKQRKGQHRQGQHRIRHIARIGHPPVARPAERRAQPFPVDRLELRHGNFREAVLDQPHQLRVALAKGAMELAGVQRGRVTKLILDAELGQHVFGRRLVDAEDPDLAGRRRGYQRLEIRIFLQLVDAMRAQIIDAGAAVLDPDRKPFQRGGIDNAADVPVEVDRHLDIGIGRREIVDFPARLGDEHGVDHIGAAGLHRLLRLGPIHRPQIDMDAVVRLP